jgi:hypothetical protein
MRPAGPELARRWLACLLLVDRADRETLVAEVEKRVAALYGEHEGAGEPGRDGAREVTVVHAPVQREGYVERTETTYAVPAEKPTETPTAKVVRKPRRKAK